MKNKLITGLLFVFLAVPGALACLFSGFGLMLYFLDNKKTPNTNPIVLVCIFLIGIFATLLGLGKLKQWLYALVFASFPFTTFLYALVVPPDMGGMPLFILTLGGVAGLIFHKVKSHYQKSNNSPNTTTTNIF